MSYEAGKGDKRRPGDQDAYANNYDAIFGKKKPKEEPPKPVEEDTTGVSPSLA